MENFGRTSISFKKEDESNGYRCLSYIVSSLHSKQNCKIARGVNENIYGNLQRRLKPEIACASDSLAMAKECHDCKEQLYNSSEIKENFRKGKGYACLQPSSLNHRIHYSHISINVHRSSYHTCSPARKKPTASFLGKPGKQKIAKSTMPIRKTM